MKVEDQLESQESTGPARERGQTIFLLALALIALIAFVGLTTDVALVYSAQRHLQRSIDAAALAAANKLPDQDEAQRAAYQFTRLHGYDFDPTSNPLDITFPVFNPPRKIAEVAGSVPVDLAFLRVIGWQSTEVAAEGVGESAPLDVYLVLDLSHSMAYDTPRPPWWNNNGIRSEVCPQTGCPDLECEEGADFSWTLCRAYYCNYEGELRWDASDPNTAWTKDANCDPLDAHIKASANYFVEQLDSRYDRVGVVTYDVQGTLAITLTSDFNAVTTTIQTLNAYQQATASTGDLQHLCTNIGDGLLVANAMMSLTPPEQGGVGGREDSVWAIVLLTDGRANRYRACNGAPGCDCSNCPPACETCPTQYCADWTGVEECDEANDWARDNAWVSWDPHQITVYAIAYGNIFFTNPIYRQLMTDIADITDNGELDGDTENFWAVPDETGLRQAFQDIAERIYTRLVR